MLIGFVSNILSLAGMMKAQCKGLHTMHFNHTKLLQIVVTHQDNVKRYTFTPSRREIGRSSGRKQTHSFARYVMENPVARQRLICEISSVASREVKACTVL